MACGERGTGTICAKHASGPFRQREPVPVSPGLIAKRFIESSHLGIGRGTSSVTTPVPAARARSMISVKVAVTRKRVNTYPVSVVAQPSVENLQSHRVAL